MFEEDALTGPIECGYAADDGIHGGKRTEIVRMADAAQYARAPIPEEQRGQIRVRLLNATPDPLGSIAALGKQYKGEVVRSLTEVTDDERRQYLDDFGKTVLNGPLEAAQFHFQIEGVTRSITHQMVRSRASFFAQESLRFAVPEGNWAQEIPLPASLEGALAERGALIAEGIAKGYNGAAESNRRIDMLDAWEDGMINAQNAYERLIDLGMPAEEARGVLPHDMPTRIHWVLDLRTLLTEAGKRTCTQAQFPWRVIFAGIAKALRAHGTPDRDVYRPQMAPERVTGDNWQFNLIADRLRPVCFQTGSCGFMAQFDRSCSIRSRVDANASIGRDPKKWGHVWSDPDGISIPAIQDWEWAANPGAARS
jgi:flavin-dependent thymidylate synthase